MKEQKKNQEQKSDNRQKLNQLNSYVKYSGLAFQMVAAIGLGVWLGMKLDSYLELKFPIFLIIFALLSITASIILTIRSLPKE